MPSPPISVFLTTIASHPSLRQRQDYILRILQVKKIPFTSYDLASDEEAKRYWKKKAPSDKQQLPGILVGGQFPGTYVEFEDAVEHDTFLRLNESWDPADETDPVPEVKPIGVPGVSLPSEMTPERLKPKMSAVHKPPASSSTEKKSEKPATAITNSDGLIDFGSELGLQGVQVTEKELEDLIKDLGLEGDDAGDLAKELSGGSA